MHATDRDLLRLALPALAALVAEPIYVLTDTAMVGHLGTTELAGLAVASAVLLTGYSLCIFLAYGTTSAVGRLLGAGQARAAGEQAIDGLWLAAGLGVVLAVVGWVGGPSLISLLGGRGEVAEQAGIYLRISLLGVPALLASLAALGYLRGLQDTRTPLWVALGAAVGNGLLEWWLIFGLGFGIGASAASTVAAQTAAAGVFVWRVARQARRHGARLGPRPRQLARLAVVGGHLLVRTAALRGSLLVGVGVATRIGTAEVAAYEIAFQVWSLGALALDAVAIAAQSLVSRALGASDRDGAMAVARRALVLSAGSGVVLGAAAVALRQPLGQLFSDDARVVALVGFSLLFVGAMQPVNGVVFALDGILIGAGDQRFLALAMAAAFALYAPLAVGVALAGLGLGWLWGALCVLMMARGTVLVGRLMSGRWAVVGAAR
ncbi:MAG: MATE family efflux transporter [Acidimicrobiales bacterium]